MAAVKEVLRITLDGGLARIERTTVEREIRTEDLVKEMLKTEPHHSGILPLGCVYKATRPAERANGIADILTVYVIQQPAGMTLIQHRRAAQPGNEEEEQYPDRCIESYTLSLPNRLWFVQLIGKNITAVFMAGTMAPLSEEGEDTKLLAIPLPNQWESDGNRFCLGKGFSLDNELNETHRLERLKEFLDESVWNTDLAPEYSNFGFASIKDWHAKSAEDPAFWKAIKYKAFNPNTFRKMLEKLLNHAQPLK